MESPKIITHNLFTKEYIEKCEKNPDLQVLWNLEVGTYYFNTQQKKLYLIESNFTGTRDKKFWIPRQDELQIILKQKIDRFKEMTDLKFDFNMRQCIFKSYCHKILCLLTLNDMWLVFFMKELFGKQWVPERKEWMVI